MSITRVPKVSVALGKLQGALASALSQFEKASQGWHEFGFPDEELDGLRDSLGKAVSASTTIQQRLATLADAFYRDHPRPRSLFSVDPREENSHAEDAAPQAGRARRNGGGS